jgi:hypothetical protein
MLTLRVGQPKIFLAAFTNIANLQSFLLVYAANRYSVLRSTEHKWYPDGRLGEVYLLSSCCSFGLREAEFGHT